MINDFERITEKLGHCMYMMFFDFLIYQKFKISMLPNLVETSHSSAKLKNKQVAKLEVSDSKNKDLVTQCI